MKYDNNLGRQAGMTLIELTVVLLILVGLAGLLIPYVGSFVQKTHDSTNSSNIAQLNNAFVRYVAENNMLPQHMDTLTNDAVTAGSGVCAGAQVAGNPYCGLLDTTMFGATAYTQPAGAVETGAAEIGYASLKKAKIRMVVNNDTTAPNKTFGSYTNMIGIADGAMGSPNVNVIRVAGVAGVGKGMAAGTVEGHMAVALGKDSMDYNSTCYDYVAFGLGDANGLVSKTIASAPVHFPEDATKGPVEYYNHYIAIVQVDKDNTTAGCTSITEPAKFLGAVMNVPNYPGSHLFGANASLGYAYENQLQGK